MKIAIATDDRIHIAKHTGKAKEFAIFTTVNGIVKNTEYLANTHVHEHEHENHQEHIHKIGLKNGLIKNEHAPKQGHSHKEIVDQMKGVDLFLVTHLGSHFKLEVETAGIPFRIIKDILIEDILKENS